MTDLIARVQTAIDSAWKHESGLPEEASHMHGLMSMKIRHLLNNMCAHPGTVFLEAGLWAGASLVSALAGNQRNIQQAYGIDNWVSCSSGRGAKNLFARQRQQHLADYGDRLRVFDHDLFTFDVAKHIHKPVNVFYYDADHDRTGDGVLAFADALADPCILMLDDWAIKSWASNTPYSVPTLWREAVERGPFNVEREWILPSNRKGDTELWWCGFYVAILTRKQVAA